jgi:hypothetical protein
MRPLLTIKVDISAGADVHAAFVEMHQLARLTRTYVQARANGVEVIVTPNCSPGTLFDKWLIALKSPHGPKVVSS